MMTQSQLLDLLEQADRQGLEIFFPKDIRDGYLFVHAEKRCQAPCPIHAPSDHPLNQHDLHWRSDRRMFERLCDHGIGHPDPDDLAYKRKVLFWSEFDRHAY